MKNILLPILIFAFASCGGDKKEATPPASQTNTPANLQDAMKQAEQTMKEVAEMQQPSEPVNFRTLQGFMPEKAAGYERTKLGGETAGAMNIKFSKAEGNYKDSSGKILRMNIMDTGGLGMGMMSMAAWSTVTIDKEDDNGYERTATFGGYKSFEKFRKGAEENELSVIAHNRFIVTAECRGCGMETLRAVVGAVDIGGLKNAK